MFSWGKEGSESSYVSLFSCRNLKLLLFLFPPFSSFPLPTQLPKGIFTPPLFFLYFFPSPELWVSIIAPLILACPLKSLILQKFLPWSPCLCLDTFLVFSDWGQTWCFWLWIKIQFRLPTTSCMLLPCISGSPFTCSRASGQGKVVVGGWEIGLWVLSFTFYPQLFWSWDILCLLAVLKMWFEYKFTFFSFAICIVWGESMRKKVDRYTTAFIWTYLEVHSLNFYWLWQTLRFWLLVSIFHSSMLAKAQFAVEEVNTHIKKFLIFRILW